VHISLSVNIFSFIVSYDPFNLRPAREFFTDGDITIAGEGLQNLGLCLAVRTFEQGRVFISPHLLWYWTSFFSPRSYPNLRTSLFNRLAHTTRKSGPSSETGKTKVPCHSRCGTIKTPHCLKTLSAEHRPKFCSRLHRQWWRLHIYVKNSWAGRKIVYNQSIRHERGCWRSNLTGPKSPIQFPRTTRKAMLKDNSDPEHNGHSMLPWILFREHKNLKGNKLSHKLQIIQLDQHDAKQ
jgi:hypothetical protein